MILMFSSFLSIFAFLSSSIQIRLSFASNGNSMIWLNPMHLLLVELPSCENWAPISLYCMSRSSSSPSTIWMLSQQLILSTAWLSSLNKVGLLLKYCATSISFGVRYLYMNESSRQTSYLNKNCHLSTSSLLAAMTSFKSKKLFCSTGATIPISQTKNYSVIRLKNKKY